MHSSQRTSSTARDPITWDARRVGLWKGNSLPPRRGMPTVDVHELGHRPAPTSTLSAPHDQPRGPRSDRRAGPVAACWPESRTEIDDLQAGPVNVETRPT